MATLNFGGLTEKQRTICCNLMKLCHGIVGICSDDVSKIEACLRQRAGEEQAEYLYETAQCLASLSNWYVQDKQIPFADAKLQCTEQLMMSYKLDFFGITGEAATEWIKRIANAENE